MNQLRRAIEDNGRTFKRPKDNRKHSPECSEIGHGQAFKQARKFLLPGEMREKRLAYDTAVSMINNKDVTNHLPEGSAMPSSMPAPSSTSTLQTEAFRLTSDKPVLMLIAKQPGPKIDSKDKEKSAEPSVTA